MTRKIILLNLIPMAVGLAAILLFVKREEQSVLIAFVLVASLLWAGVVYTGEAVSALFTLAWRLLFGKEWSREARKRKRRIEEVKPVRSDDSDTSG